MLIGAYRAGLLHGLLLGLDWELTGRAASLMGAIKIESRGTQNHRFTLEEFERRFAQEFDMSLEPSVTRWNAGLPQRDATAAPTSIVR